MGWRRRILVVIAVLGGWYCLVALPVILRHSWWCEPRLAAQAYLRALQQRDAPAIYLYSHLLAAHLESLLKGSRLDEEQRKNLSAKDFMRWKTEFERGAASNDVMRRECRLLVPGTVVEAVSGEKFRAEVIEDGDRYLAEYKDVPGRIYHLYYRLTYPHSTTAPPVSLLDNVRTGRKRRIKSVVVRLEVSRRPSVTGLRRLLLDWAWLAKLNFLVPVGLFPTESDPSRLWAVELSFAVDKLTLETF